jgi:penicillin G amidase
MAVIRRILIGVVIIVLVLSILVVGTGFVTIRRHWPKVDGTVQVDGLRSQVTVMRDGWGIPHIYADNTYDLFFAQGYVQSQDRFWQMEFSRRTGSGRLSEVLGEAALESDKFIRTVGWHRAAARDLEIADDYSLANLQAFADGVNAYIANHRNRLGLEFTLLGLTGRGFEPEPWTPLNTMTWAKVMAWSLGGNMNAELSRAHLYAKLGAPALQVFFQPYPEGHPVIVPYPLVETSLETVPQAAYETFPLGLGEGIGSNNWVIAGSRTDTGMPFLANDPHLGIQMPSIWYESGMHCTPVTEECPFDVVGASFPGVPGIILGHNNRIAWGVTNLGPDVQDLFIEKVHPDDPDKYEYKGQWLDMELVPEIIYVAGREEPVVVVARLTRHGPIINDVVAGTEDDWSFGWQPLALSWTALQEGTLMRSVMLLNSARNWEEFRQALSYWDVPSQNFVYADIEGNIGYQAPGRIPIRANGDGSLPAPGWSGDYDWIGMIPFDELPRSFNPPEGYIVTANNAVVGRDYPYFLSRDWDYGYRARRIAELIEAQPVLSLDDMKTIQGDNAPLWVDELLPYIAALSPDDPRLVEALDQIRAWDGQASRDSVAISLIESTRLHMLRLTFEDELGEALLRKTMSQAALALQRIIANPDSEWFNNRNTQKIERRDDLLLQALEAAVDEMTGSLGRRMANWRWGDLHTASFVNPSLGASGIRPIEAIFNRGPVAVDGTTATINNTGYRLSTPYQVSTVASYRQIVDLNDLTRSVSMHTTGQSGHPYHRHYDDMIDPWRNIQYHPMLWGQVDVEKDVKSTLILEP